MNLTFRKLEEFVRRSINDPSEISTLGSRKFALITDLERGSFHANLLETFFSVKYIDASQELDA